MLIPYLEWPVLDIMLNTLVVPSSTNHSFDVKDCVFWVWGKLVLGGISYQSFIVLSEGYVWWGDTVSLVICDNFYSSIFEHTNTKIQINRIILQVQHSVCTIYITTMTSLPWVCGSQVNTNYCTNTVFIIWATFLITVASCHHQCSNQTGIQESSHDSQLLYFWWLVSVSVRSRCGRSWVYSLAEVGFKKSEKQKQHN